VLDVNRHGEYEEICWTNGTPPGSGNVYIVSCYGEELSRWTVPYEGINIRLFQAMGDVDGDVSEWVCELNGPSCPETMVYCLTMNGEFPADAWWPEY
jgi:hypothetical protein